MACALEQHAAYEQTLQALGVRLERLPDAPDLPDAVFVEDTAIVVDELAIVSSMAVSTRRPETSSVVSVLGRHRRLAYLAPPATLDGGDVLRIDRTLFVGLSTRTNKAAVEQMTHLLEPYDYRVIPVTVTGCLHLKTGCTHVTDDVVLVNPAWLDVAAFSNFECLSVPDDEPFGANVLSLGGVAVMPAAAPKTAELIGRRVRVQPVDISELAKAEAGVTCMSIVFRN